MANAPEALKYYAREAVARVGGELSGIVGDAAHTYGYHRAFNEVGSGDYSRQVPLDQVGGTNLESNASAVDWSLPADKMKLVTGRLIKAADHPEDNRLDVLREFYGTTNGSDVVGRQHDGAGQSWDFATSDDSHLWHVHHSFFRKYSNDKAAADKVLSVVSGETWEAYKARTAGGGSTPPPPKPPGGAVGTLKILDGVNMDSVSNKLKTYLEHLAPADLISRLYITSANRGSSGVDYHEDTGSNGAMDVAGPMNDQGQRDMQALARLVMADKDLFLEVIHTTPFSDDNGFYVKNGQDVGPGFYGAATEAEHLNHVHLATSESMGDALIARHPGGGGGSTPPPEPPPPVGDPDPKVFPLPSGHYFGDINGPNESHGGDPSAPASDRAWIKKIQEKLQEKGFAPKTAGWADGLYEQPTIDAAKAFQAANQLPVDGKVGPQTWAKLFAKAAPPPVTPPPVPPKGGLAATYTVKKGDTLRGIAKKFGVLVESILRYNPQIKDPNKIKPGDIIKLL